MANAAGFTSAIMNALAPECVIAAHASDLLLGNDPWAPTGSHSSGLPPPHRPQSEEQSVTDDTKLDEAAGHDGRGRVILRFEPSGVETRVPPGVNLFDAASWNGVAIDSTCGGHGTCKKCRVRIVDGDTPISRLDVRAFTTDELRDGWRLACRAVATTASRSRSRRSSTRPKAATVGVGRQVILRPSLQKRYLELEDPTLEDQASDLERVLARDRRPRAAASSWTCCASSARRCARRTSR